MACRSDKCMQYFGTSAGHAEARWCNSWGNLASNTL
jgi:hypothetical protein